MPIIKCTTQAELDAALQNRKYGDVIELSEAYWLNLFDNSSARLSGNSSARLFDNSSASLFDNSSARLSGNSSARLFDNSSARLSGNSSASLSGTATVHAYDKARIKALSPYTTVVKHGAGVIIEGTCNVVVVPDVDDIETWIALNGVELSDDGATAILYKGVREDYHSAHGLLYAVGTVPVAPDWDGGRKECGAGLHFCANPHETLNFDGEIKHFLACPVALEDIRSPSTSDNYPNKVKAKGLCAPCWEVDIHGNRLTPLEIVEAEA